MCGKRADWGSLKHGFEKKLPHRFDGLQAAVFIDRESRLFFARCGNVLRLDFAAFVAEAVEHVGQNIGKSDRRQPETETM